MIGFKRLSRMLAAGAMLSCAALAGAAGKYPEKTVKLVVPFSAGGNKEIHNVRFGSRAGWGSR